MSSYPTSITPEHNRMIKVRGTDRHGPYEIEGMFREEQDGTARFCRPDGRGCFVNSRTNWEESDTWEYA